MTNYSNIGASYTLCNILVFYVYSLIGLSIGTSNITDLITVVVQLLRRDINGLVKTALGELEPVKL